jgi:hypothetical protein
MEANWMRELPWWPRGAQNLSATRFMAVTLSLLGTVGTSPWAPPTLPELTRTKRRSVFIHLTCSGRGVIEFLLHVSKGPGRPGRYRQPAAMDLSKISNPIPWAGLRQRRHAISPHRGFQTSVTLPFDPAPEIWTLLPWNWRGERNIFEPWQAKEMLRQWRCMAEGRERSYRTESSCSPMKR